MKLKNKSQPSAQPPPKTSKIAKTDKIESIYSKTKYGWTDYLIFDLTFWFTVAVILVPVVLVYPHQEKMFTYISLPSIWGSFVLLFVVLVFTHLFGTTHTLSARQQRIANWFLCNGVFINIFLDVFAGQFQWSGLMTEQYNILEPRYVMGLYHDAGQVVFMTSMLELLLQAPLCLITYWGFYHNTGWKEATGIIASVLHFTGIWWMYVPEILRGFPHIPADRNFRFSFHDILYYWFGFWFCCGLWTLVPILLTITLTRDISAQISKKK